MLLVLHISRCDVSSYHPDVNKAVMIPMLSSIFVKMCPTPSSTHLSFLQAYPKPSTNRLTLAPPFMIDTGPATPMRKAERAERVIESDPHTVPVMSSVFDAGMSR